MNIPHAFVRILKKRKLSFLFFIILWCVGHSSALYAQEPSVTIRLNNASFEEFVRQAESQTGYTFYYDAANTDSLRISLNMVNSQLSVVLERVLHEQGLFFTILSGKRVFVTSGQALITHLDAIGSRQQSEPLSGDSLHAVKPRASLAHLTDYSGDTTETIIAIENRLFEFGTKGQVVRDRILSGYIRDADTGLPIPFALIEVQGHSLTTHSDQQGYFTISIPEERATVKISGVGKKETQRQLLMYGSARLDIALNERVYALAEVIVSGSDGTGVTRTQMGIERLTMATIRQTPAVFGEADIVRVILTLPGVQTVGEAAAGFNVRGGATDQNLVLYNDATIYNPSHFFGFFSSFNPDGVSSVELYKSSIPARFGGRLSSVLDVSAKEGNRQKFSGAGGIGPLTGRLTLEGPIGKKTSFLVGGRSTYSDWLMKLIPDEGYQNSSASFFDTNFQVTHEPNEKNTVYAVGYFSNDRFGLGRDTLYSYQNLSTNLKWKHVYNNRIHSLLTVGLDRYDFTMTNTNLEPTSYRLGYGIHQTFAKAELHHHLNERHRLLYGLSSILYSTSPGSVTPLGALSEVVEKVLQPEQALESALHLTDVFQINDRLEVDLGLRYSMFNVLGPRNDGTTSYQSGAFIKTYHAPEIRFGARYRVATATSLKIGYNSLRQYIHMLSNTTSITPTDTWKLSDQYIRPQFGDQLSIGFYQNFNSDRIETSVELYYKRMQDYLDYKSGARLLMNPNIERDVLGTEARAYGVEFLVKKLTGRLNGWFSYTYSRVEQRTVDVPEEDMINGGAYYPSNHDKPHNLTLVGNYKFSHRVSFSLNGTYSTGRPITLPIAVYYYAGNERVFYSERNQYRIPDYFRLDASFNIEGNHKVRKLAHSSWTVGVYNVTGRRNPFSVFYLSEPDGIKGYKLSIFGSQIPFLTYNFKF